ncbi:MAG: hypothetical protein ACI8TQ_001265 [Planctomycetota bacterium]|jgi:hypothetical protein
MMLSAVLWTSMVFGFAETSAADQVSYQDLSVEVEGRLIDTRMVQVTGDDRLELVLVTLASVGGKREVLIYTHPEGSKNTDAYAPVPWRKISVFDDVVAYTFANVRSEPGQELVFFTSKGVYSMSPKIESLRGNISRLIDHELVYEVADVTQLPYWKYVLPGVRDLLVVPGASTFSVWGPSADRPREYEQQTEFSEFARAGSDHEDVEFDGDESTSISVGNGGASIRNISAAGRILVESGTAFGYAMLSYNRKYAAPGLGDVNGDGLTDVVVLGRTRVGIYLATVNGLPSKPSRIESLPEYLLTEGAIPPNARFDLVDFDDDGDADLIFRNSKENEESAIAADIVHLLFLRNTGQRMIPAKPDQLMKFESLSMRSSLADVDADGTIDLVIRKFELPSLLDAVTSLEFTQTTMFFPGTGAGSGRVFQRQPRMKSERLYDADTLSNAISRKSLAFDFSGDGLADMVEVDLDGHVFVERVEYESGFFSGESWTLEQSPWKRFETKGSIASLVVDDFNNDGLGDVISSRRDGVLLLMSKRPRKSR